MSSASANTTAAGTQSNSPIPTKEDELTSAVAAYDPYRTIKGMLMKSSVEVLRNEHMKRVDDMRLNLDCSENEDYIKGLLAPIPSTKSVASIAAIVAKDREQQAGFGQRMLDCIKILADATESAMHHGFVSQLCMNNYAEAAASGKDLFASARSVEMNRTAIDDNKKMITTLRGEIKTRPRSNTSSASGAPMKKKARFSTSTKGLSLPSWMVRAGEGPSDSAHAPPQVAAGQSASSRGQVALGKDGGDDWKNWRTGLRN